MEKRKVTDYQCIIIHKETGEPEKVTIRLDPSVMPFDQVINQENGIFRTLGSWEDMKKLSDKENNGEEFYLKTVTL